MQFNKKYEKQQDCVGSGTNVRILCACARALKTKKKSVAGCLRPHFRTKKSILEHKVRPHWVI